MRFWDLDLPLCWEVQILPVALALLKFHQSIVVEWRPFQAWKEVHHTPLHEPDQLRECQSSLKSHVILHILQARQVYIAVFVLNHNRYTDRGCTLTIADLVRAN
jgi:hypothetical protein